MTAATLTPGTDQQVDARGYAYDSTWLDNDGVRHYRRVNALGVGCGPATWSDLWFENPICGDNLAAKCRSCHRCLDCSGDGHGCQ